MANTDSGLPNYWQTYLQLRFNAYRNLLKIIGYQTGAQIDPTDDVNNVAAFALLWREKINPGERTGMLERDAVPWIIQVEGGDVIEVQFIASDGSESKLAKTAIVPALLTFMRRATGMGDEADAEQLFARTETVRGKRLILVSMAGLEGAAKNMIIEFNSLLEHPIRHFTVEELQFDPTEHKAGPKSMTSLTPPEIRRLIDEQKGLAYGTTRLVPEFEERLIEFEDENDRIDFINKTDEEVLNRLPTINTSDPWVKWRGFKAGEVVRIIRRFGKNRITYRRVVYLEPIAMKPPKSKTAITKN